ncbi:DUF5009 domain-containing protein [Agriterribacter sp.]|uniref:DUF5009 domain-containing protein n=1 Tax=Agriterribacter sp. TaxID=2821509 RepID=UPI002B76D207|nr:DUF5009 domain-containing protein [Agriterribacter sp.]HRO48318.1 DUF5009 domain-containing protein [Agriterribacter sp.]HRQ15971.1 DUF5009 domain-containing protein [Agriterribacter sp.]
MHPSLQPQRILSIDAFRGITILVMVFVNELAGIRDIPLWMKHVPASADAMTFVDVVFPAFLFIVGMSVPFALKNRVQKGDRFLQLQWHILWRTLGLLVLGVFMVNGEGGYHKESMGMSIHLWLLLFYICAVLIWNVYRSQKRIWVYLLRTAGIAGLLMLAAVYRGGEDGSASMTPRWWGILGLIGWAYLFGCIFFQLFRKNIVMMLAMICFCIAFYIAGKSAFVQESGSLRWISSQTGNAAHTSVVLCGIVLSLIYFDKNETKAAGRRFIAAGIFTLLLFVAGYVLRPYFGISKIYATPTWCLYSAGICCIIFSVLYWLIDIKKISSWTRFFKPAAVNPLLTYIIPGILYALFAVLHISIFPYSMRYGVPGFLWAVFYAIAVMYIAKGLNRLNIKLQL